MGALPAPTFPNRFRRVSLANAAKLGGDKNVLDSFAADYREPSKKIPGDTIQK